MADVLKPFEVCRVLQHGSLCGIKRHAQEENIILTFRDRGIVVYNLQHHKLINSWSVEQNDNVTCAAVQNPAVNEFIVGVNKTEIFTWKECDPDLKSCQRIQLDKPIFGFHVWTSQQYGALVVFEDGSSRFLEDLLKEQESGKVKRKKVTKSLQELFWSAAFVHQSQPYVACIKIREEHKYSVDISNVGMSSNTESQNKTVDNELIPPSEGAELLSCCMHEEGHSITSYWSDGSLCITELDNVLQPDTNSTKTHMISKKIHRLQPFHSGKKKKQRSVAMSAIDGLHVCLCGCCSLDGCTKAVITIWNIKYGTLQSWQTLDDMQDENPLHSYGANFAGCTPSFLCIGLSQVVVACPYSISEGSLACSLGQLGSTSRFVMDEPLKPELLVTPKLATPCQAVMDWLDSLEKENQEERQVLEKLTDPTQTPTLETFSAELTNYLELRHTKQGDKARKFRGRKVKGFKRKEVLSQHFITSVLSRCVKEKRFWTGDFISKLLKTKCVPSSCSKELLTFLLERSELGLVMECFENIKGIPEEAVVLCLRHVLSLDDKAQTEDSSAKDAEHLQTNDGGICRMPLNTTTANYLCTLLSYPVNDVFLQDSLKKLSFKEVILLMRFFVHIIHCGPFENEAWSGMKYPQVLDWAGLLLNAHCTQLVLMPEAHELLVSCHRKVHAQVRCYDKLRTLESFLAHYKNHVALPSVVKTGIYTVEMVEI